MVTPLYLKSETFGMFEGTYVPAGGVCPPGQVNQALPECLIGPCPDLCVAGEPMTLSGEPLVPSLPPTLEDVQRQQVAEQGTTPAAAAPSPRSMLRWLWILLPVSLIVAAAPRRAEGRVRW